MLDKAQIVEYIKYIIWFLIGSGLVFEISPIKINPISAILGWIGKKLNKDVKRDIEGLQSKVDTVQLDLQTHKVESWRRDILNFADSLSRGKLKTKENFMYVINLHDNYEKYLAKNGLENGQVSLAYKYIEKVYQECVENNSFYTGK